LQIELGSRGGSVDGGGVITAVGGSVTTGGWVGVTGTWMLQASIEKDRQIRGYRIRFMVSPLIDPIII